MTVFEKCEYSKKKKVSKMIEQSISKERIAMTEEQ